MTPNFRHYPGYYGRFTREQANGAIPNGTRIIKQNSEQGDAHPDGSLGTILGSVTAPDDLKAALGVQHFYFVEWDALPRVAVGAVDKKVRRV